MIISLLQSGIIWAGKFMLARFSAELFGKLFVDSMDEIMLEGIEKYKAKAALTPDKGDDRRAALCEKYWKDFTAVAEAKT